MNLHAIASSVISTINPMRPVRVFVSTGAVVKDDGEEVSGYASPVAMSAQVQSMSYGDIQHVDALNIQGDQVAIYLNGKVDGITRSKGKGGDLIVFDDGPVYLVSTVIEDWPDWTKVAATLQDDASPPQG